MKDTGNHLGSASTVPTLDVAGKGKVEKRELEEADLLIASPIVYGFSLSDKIWREFSFTRPPRTALIGFFSRVQRREDF